METIYKYPLTIVDEQDVPMPRNARLLSVQLNRDHVCLWAVVDPDEDIELRRIFCHGTGHDVDPNATRHLGTVQMRQGTLVFHFFDSHL